MIKTGNSIIAGEFVPTITAGESLSAADTVMIGTGTDTGVGVVRIENTDDASESVTSSTWIAQKVTLGAAREITHVAFKVQHFSSRTFTVKIRSSLTGADLASGTYNTGGSSNSGLYFRNVTLSTPLAVSGGEELYVIFYDSSTGTTPRGETVNTYTGGEAYISTDSGATWNTHGTIADFQVLLTGGITQAGKAYKAINDSSDYFIGFAQEAAAIDQNVTVNNLPYVTGFSGLTLGQKYYLHDTNPGELKTSGAFFVGVAISETTLMRRYT